MELSFLFKNTEGRHYIIIKSILIGECFKIDRYLFICYIKLRRLNILQIQCS